MERRKLIFREDTLDKETSDCYSLENKDNFYSPAAVHITKDSLSNLSRLALAAKFVRMQKMDFEIIYARHVLKEMF